MARAIELGVNYFDTAPLYGDGQSEVNLGAILRELRADVIVGTEGPHRPERYDAYRGGRLRGVHGGQPAPAWPRCRGPPLQPAQPHAPPSGGPR
ncbi:MAG: aldo/keto reductase [Rhodopseudomonas palustris]|nr:aldo/keto reductase [Rhodopseudomonas palustris]